MDDNDVIPDGEGVVPPIGHILVQDTDGNRFWVPKDAIELSTTESELSEKQIERVKKCWAVFGDDAPMSVERLLASLRRDSDPEREIGIWERIAEVYAAELAERPDASARERVLLFEAALTCSSSMDPEQMISAQPRLKGLPHLERVVRRYHGLP